MVHESRLPFAPTVRLRLKQPARTLLTLTIFAIAACDRPEQLAAPTPIEPSVLVDEATVASAVATAATSGAAATASLIALKSSPAMCLEIAGSPSAAEAKTRVASCNVNNAAQLFTVNQTTKEIVSSGGRCVAAFGTGADALGSAIGLAACNKSARTLWTIDSSTGQLIGLSKGCITIRGNALTSGAEEFLGSCGSFPNWSQSFAIISASGGGGGTTPPPATATSISVTPASVAIGVGATVQLAAVARDASGNPVSGATFTYSMLTSGQAASVSATGLVTGKAAGKDTVRVVSGTLSAKVGVNVLAIAPPPPPPPAPPPSGLKAIDPTLPLDSVKVIWPVRTGKVIAVHAGDNLQNALSQAQRGDEIVIDPVTFTGNFVLPAKSGTAANGWIVVRSANMSALPPAGARATARFAGAMPKLVTPNVSPALATASGTSGWYIAGIEMTNNSPSQYIHYGLVNLGRGDKQQTTLASIPSNIILDRVYIHGITSVSVQRCVGLNSAHTAIVNSTLSQCAAKGFDSQAIGGWNGPGPYRIQNNYLEGAGENIMFGGADPFIANLVPSDITIRGNHVTKQLAWKGKFTIKNLLETKNARRVLIENNIFENNWVDAQTGFAISLKSANQGGSAPWSITSDVTFRYNILRNSAAGFAISANPSAHPALPAARIKVEHNLLYDVGSFQGTTNGRMFQLMQQLNDVQIVSNTLVHNAVTGQFLIFADKGPAQRFIVRDNISSWGGPYGAVMGTATPQGTQALASFAGSSYTFDRNVVGGLPSNLVGGYPTTSFYPPTMTAVGFINMTVDDYRLTASSPYALKSTTNGNPGADVSTVTSRTANVIVP